MSTQTHDHQRHRRPAGEVAEIAWMRWCALDRRVLAVLGDRIDKLRVPALGRDTSDAAPTKGLWAGIARTVMAYPAVSLVLAVGVLVLAASPLLGIRTGLAGVSTLPEDTQSRQAFTVLADEFAGGLTQPAQVVIEGP